MSTVAHSLRFFHNSPGLGPDFIRRFFGDMDLTLSRDQRQMLDWLAAGKFPIAFFISGVEEAGKQQGLPVKMFDPSAFSDRAFVGPTQGSTAQLAIAFGTDADEAAIYQRVVDGLENKIASVVVPTGPCKEEIITGNAVDLYKFPTPYWHELDTGQYIGTMAGVITRDPDTGVINMGSYRVMIKDKNMLATNIRGAHPIGGEKRELRTRDRTAADDIVRNEAKGLATPIALALSMDPLLTLASGSSVPADERGFMEYEAAGGWRGRPTELVSARRATCSFRPKQRSSSRVKSFPT